MQWNILKICIFVSSYKKKGESDMARPIRETPVLFGKDARLFEERMKNPRKVSKAERERVKKNYELVMKAATNFK